VSYSWVSYLAVIVTDYDPKDYTTIEIKNEVDNAVDFCIEN